MSGDDCAKCCEHIVDCKCHKGVNMKETSILQIDIDKELKLVKFTNNSDYKIIISLMPVKPKRTYKDIALVPHGNYIMYENTELDLTTLSFRFEDA